MVEADNKATTATEATTTVTTTIPLGAMRLLERPPFALLGHNQAVVVVGDL